MFKCCMSRVSGDKLYESCGNEPCTWRRGAMVPGGRGAIVPEDVGAWRSNTTTNFHHGRARAL